MNSPRIIIAILCIISPATLSFADGPTALFLERAQPSARLSALGGIFTSASATDVFDGPWSPAAGRSGFSVAHWPGTLEGSSYQFAGLALAANEAVVTVTYLRYGAGTETMEDTLGAVRSVRLEENQLVGVGYGRGILPGLRAGLAVKYLQSTLAEDFRAGSVLGDAGLLYRSKDGVHSAGLALRNAGQPVTYYRTAEALPSEAVAGYTWTGDYEAGAVLVGLSCAQSLADSRRTFAGGIGYFPADSPFTLAGGARSRENILALSAGAGLVYRDIELDAGYEFTTSKISGGTPLRFTLSYFWGKGNGSGRPGHRREPWYMREWNR